MTRVFACAASIFTVFHTELARLVSDEGFDLRPGANNAAWAAWEIDAIPRHLIEKASRRTAAIKTYQLPHPIAAAEHKRTEHRFQSDFAAKATRPPKVIKSSDQLTAEFLDYIGPANVEIVRRCVATRDPTHPEDASRWDTTAKALSNVFPRRSASEPWTLSGTDLLCAALNLSEGRASYRECVNALLLPKKQLKNLLKIQQIAPNLWASSDRAA
jgi:hypothetical protein